MGRLQAMAWALAGAAFLAGCASLPPPGERADTRAFEDTGTTTLGRAVSVIAAAHPGRTGVHAMTVGTDAFAARIALARAAQRSIDAQYYIWHTDETGMLLFEELAAAARRGVRVRLLLDDHGSHGADDVIAALGWSRTSRSASTTRSSSAACGSSNMSVTSSA
jgi:cardiolipin synthase C